MTEPTATAAAAAVGVITIAGVSTGLQYEVLLPALTGALWALTYLPEARAAQRAAQVIVGTLLGAWGAPGMSHAMGLVFPWAKSAPVEMVLMPSAFGIAYLSLGAILPRLRRFVRGSEGGK